MKLLTTTSTPYEPSPRSTTGTGTERSSVVPGRFLATTAAQSASPPIASGCLAASRTRTARRVATPSTTRTTLSGSVEWRSVSTLYSYAASTASPLTTSAIWTANGSCLSGAPATVTSSCAAPAVAGTRRRSP